MKALDFASEIGNGKSTLAFPAKEKSFKVMIDSLVEQNERHLHMQPIIERVPQLLRNSASNNKDYDPMMVSIGPYHHGKKEFQMAEKVKPIMAQLYVSGSSGTLHEFYIAILPKLNDLKSYYVKGSTNEYSNEEFATMMLLDGCLVLAIIELFDSAFSHKWQIYMDEINCLDMHAQAYFIYDILWLMENQLPLKVLQLLMSLKCKGGDGMKMISTFLDFGVYRDIKPGREIKKPSTFFRSVTKLKAKGIYVRCSGYYHLTSIKFRSFFFVGLLDLPIIIISPSRRIAFSNLIAYELTLGDDNMCSQTSYINFMKSLINHPDDVKELRSKHILINEQYSSDKEVVNIMKSITTCLMTHDLCEEVREMIKKHYNSKVKTWIAKLIHNYFSSPWAFMAFLAAILVVA
ncbi:hypothetical protein NMG60_11002693 [Bertholletia excelsa]